MQTKVLMQTNESVLKREVFEGRDATKAMYNKWKIKLVERFVKKYVIKSAKISILLIKSMCFAQFSKD